MNIKILTKFRNSVKLRFKIHKTYEMKDNMIKLESWYKNDLQIFPNSYIIHIREDLLKDKLALNSMLLHELGHMWYIHRKSDLKDEIQADCFAIEFGADIDTMLKMFNPNDEEYYGKY